MCKTCNSMCQPNEIPLLCIVSNNFTGTVVILFSEVSCFVICNESN